MSKYILAIALTALAACKTTDASAPVSCQDRVKQFADAQQGAGHVFNQQGAIAANTFAIAFADGPAPTTFFALILVAPGGMVPPAPFVADGSCVTKGTTMLVYTGDIPAGSGKQARLENGY